MVINTLTALFSFVATLFGALPQAVSRLTYSAPLAIVRALNRIDGLAVFIVIGVTLLICLPNCIGSFLCVKKIEKAGRYLCPYKLKTV